MLPPSRSMAFSAAISSSSQSGPLYAIKHPPTFTKGRQYSDKVLILATALDTQRSKDSLKCFFLPSSSALPWTAFTFSIPSSSQSFWMILILLFSESISVNYFSGKATARGIPGNPPPVPTSMIVSARRNSGDPAHSNESI